MTISGEMTRRQRISRRLRPALGCLVFAGGGTWFISGRHPHTPFSPDLHLLLLAFFPVLGALVFGLRYWSDRLTIVEFACDESSIWFRKLGKAPAETRALSEVGGVYDFLWGGYCVPERHLGYRLVFKDGAEAFLPDSFVEASSLAWHLRVQSRGE